MGGQDWWLPLPPTRRLLPSPLAEAWGGSGRNKALLKILQLCSANCMLGDAAWTVCISYQGWETKCGSCYGFFGCLPPSQEVKVEKGLRQMLRPSFPSCWTFGTYDAFLFSVAYFSFLSEAWIKNRCFSGHMFLVICSHLT